MKAPALTTVLLKTAVIHTVTYFLVGLAAFTLLDYANRYADPVVAMLMRQTDDPLVAAGLLFQPLRGVLFGLVFYALGEVIFTRKSGWLTAWLMLVIVGVISPFGASPSSIEGLLYTVLPAGYHAAALPELLVQTGLLAFGTWYWVRHPEKKWLGWVLGIALVIVLLLAALGVLAALGALPAA